MNYERIFQVAWGDLDANGHMRNTAYLDRCVDVRLGYFNAQGVSPEDFVRHQIGPVIARDDVEYFRELRLFDEVRVTFLLAGVSPNASRFQFRHELFRADGKLAARVTTTGGWLDLRLRRLTAPPPGIGEAIDRLTHSDDFAALTDSVRGG